MPIRTEKYWQVTDWEKVLATCKTIKVSMSATYLKFLQNNKQKKYRKLNRKWTRYRHKLFTAEETQTEWSVWKKYTNWSAMTEKQIQTTKYHLKWTALVQMRKLDNATRGEIAGKTGSPGAFGGRLTCVCKHNCTRGLSNPTPRCTSLRNFHVDQNRAHLLLCCYDSGIGSLWKTRRRMHTVRQGTAPRIR